MTTRQLIGRTLLVILLAGLAGGCAYALSDSRERQYEATTKLLFSGSTPELRAVGVVETVDEEERAIVNNVARIGSFDIARRTAEALDDPAWDADDIASRMRVFAARGGDVVTIAARAPSAEDAAIIAQASRREFILRSREVVRARAREARRAVREAMGGLNPVVRRGPRGDAMRSQLASLAVVQRVGGEPLVVEGVRASTRAVSPNVTRDTLFGLLLGAVLGVGLVALRGATSPSRRTAATGDAQGAVT